MKLTAKKLESLILEAYSREQKRKILGLIRKTRHLLLELQVIQGFYPTIINAIYSYGDAHGIKRAIQNSVKVPHVKKVIIDHYNSMKRVAEILEEVNQYLVLLESLEIEGNLAFIAKGMIYGNLLGPTAGNGQKIKLEELSDFVRSGAMFMEEVEFVDPQILGEGDLALEAIQDIVDSFHNNYSDLKDYL